MTIEDCKRELRAFLNEKGQLLSMPSKHRKKLFLYYYLGTKLEDERSYTEHELNELLDKWALFHDAATLRRELFVKRLLDRKPDGSLYWKEAVIPPLEDFIARYS